MSIDSVREEVTYSEPLQFKIVNISYIGIKWVRTADTGGTNLSETCIKMIE